MLIGRMFNRVLLNSAWQRLDPDTFGVAGLVGSRFLLEVTNFYFFVQSKICLS